MEGLGGIRGKRPTESKTGEMFRPTAGAIDSILNRIYDVINEN